jgi:hypothetical protein
MTAAPFPPLLADVSLDLFAVVQNWRPPTELSGSERGRFFEQVFFSYCQRRGFHLVEQAGSNTLNGQRAASGFHHESDAVIRCGDILLQVELKHLTHELGKNELLVFNQKGLDFLFAQNSALRQRPLYRLVVSAGPLAPAARAFALQWGLIVVEPNHLPLPVLYSLACQDKSPWPEVLEICREVPHLIIPLQARTTRFVAALADGGAIILPSRVERMLTVLQKQQGDRYRRGIERAPAGLVLERYGALRPMLDRLSAVFHPRRPVLRDPLALPLRA